MSLTAYENTDKASRAWALFKQWTTSFCGLKADKPRGMLVDHEKNLLNTSCRRVVYEFFECSSNIPSGLSAYNP